MFSRTLCNGRAVSVLMVLVTALGFLVVPALGAVHLSYEAGTSGLEFGAALAALEDLNGDGRTEFLFGAPGYPGGVGSGAAFLWLGGTSLTVAADRTWTGAANEAFGFSVAAVGDVNGDGEPDWAVGAPQPTTADENPGKVYIFFGGGTLPTAPDLTLTGAAANDQFGFAVAGAGDFDGDGIDDLIVGAPYNDTAGLDAGAAYILYGRSGGPSTNLADATRLTGQIAGDHFGWSVTAAGNFLGGTAASVAVGAPHNDSNFGIEAGAVYVFEGALGGGTPNTVSDHLIGVGADAAYSWYGFVVRGIGRWNSDSYDDLAVGAPTNPVSVNRPGRVEVILGGTSPAATGDVYAGGEAADDRFGYALAAAGDVVGSSYVDLLIGAPYQDGDGADSGRAYLLPGASASVSNAASLALSIGAADWPLPGTRSGDRFGFAVGGGGDFDGDGLADYAVGAPGGNVLSGTTAGFCRIEDTSGEVVPTLLRDWSLLRPAPTSALLCFRLGLSPLRVAALTLDRHLIDAAGNLVADERLWAAPATVGQDAAVPERLVLNQETYSYLDLRLPVAETGTLEYVLSGTTVDGDAFRLAPMSGPLATGAVPAAGLALQSARPNPFNPQTSIRFQATAGRPVRCLVSDVRGRLVARLFDGIGTGDWQTVTWDGANVGGGRAASGVYLIRVESDGSSRTGRVVLAK